MRFKKIKEIKNSEAFDSFEWKGPDLRRLNLIYGWNGSGKTTTSRVFGSVEKGGVVDELTPATFQIQTDSKAIKSDELTAPDANIRVFNDDFVRDHLRFHESKTKQILIAGKSSVEAEEEIRALTEKQKDLERQQKELTTARGKLKPLEEILTQAGTAVVKQFADTPLGNSDYSGRTYKRTQVQKQIDDGKITEPLLETLIIQKQEDVDRRREVIKSHRQKVSVVLEGIPDFSGLFSDANALLAVAPTVEEIAELSSDDDRRAWVEEGYSIHRDRKSEDCLFCGKRLDAGHLDRLGRFFTQELEDVKKKIDDAVSKLDTPVHKGEIGEVESGALLPDLSVAYITTKATAEKHAIEIRAAVGTLVDALKEKRKHLQDKAYKASGAAYPAKAVADFNSAVEKLDGTVKKHNEEIDKTAEAAKEIELHTIAGTLKDREYFQKKAEIEDLDTKIKGAKDELTNVEREIKDKRAVILSAAIAIKKINDMLAEFFGDGHIYLEIDTAGGTLGYVLKRRGKNAKNLSEGEKSVIALAYFLTKLEEGGFDKKEGCVVIDDPVDSQDELFLFRTYGLLKRHLNKCGQLVLLTHNFPLFNLIRDWFVHENKRCKQRKEDPVAELYSMRCQRTATTHSTAVEPLHDLLRAHKTDYQYLFYQLYKFNAGGAGVEDPLVPNIGRKVLEYFASFKWSCDVGDDLAGIIQSKFIDDANATPDQRAIGDFILKFMDEYSHGRDFARPISATTFEAKPVAENVIKLIGLADPEHFERLKALCEAQ